MEEVAPPIIDPNQRKSPLDLQACKKCNQLIYEGHAYELGDDRWHIDCFICSKCSSSLGCNSNFLVLGNGNLICSNCSYNCKQCGKKIDDLAILTGDQAYCSNCFKCRSCKQNIEDLRYARTSKGLFCMDCHEKLMLKKKKYDAKKKLIAQKEQESKEKHEEELQRQKDLELDKQKQEEIVKSNELDESRNSNNSSRNSLLQSYLTTPSSNNTLNNNTNLTDSLLLPSAHLNTSTTSLIKDKSLPIPPSDRPRLESHDSYSSARSDLDNDHKESTHPNPHDNDFSIEEVVNDSDDEDFRTERPSLRTPKASVPIPSLRRPQSPKINESQHHDPNPTNIYLDLIDGPETPKSSSDVHDALDITPKQESLPLPTTNGGSTTTNKNVLILSPNQFNNNEFHSANLKSPVQSSSSSQLTIHTNGSNSNHTVKSQNLSIGEEPKSRSNCPSPFAKANRQARVVETNDEVQPGIDDITDDNDNDGDDDDHEVNNNEKKTRGMGDGFDNDYNNESDKTSVMNTPNIISTPSKRVPNSSHSSLMSSPPPKLPLPSTPIKKRFKYDEIETTPKGLGLEGVDYENNIANEQRTYLKQLQDKQQQQQQQDQGSKHPPPQQQIHDDYIVNNKTPLQPSSSTTSSKSQKTIGSATPAVTNLEETVSNDDETSLQQSSSLSSSISRMGSIRTPKLSSLKHKRSTSGGGGGHSASNSISKFFKSSTSTGSKEDLKGHSRHVSDGSISNASAFTTPPLPSPRANNYVNGGYSTNFHIRSTSDTPFLTSLEHHEERQSQPYSHQRHGSSGLANNGSSEFNYYDNFEVKSLKFEIGQLNNQKSSLENDIKKLVTDKLKLNDQLKLLQSKVITETQGYEALIQKIRDLEIEKSYLVDANEKLKYQNHQHMDRRNGPTSSANTTISSRNMNNDDDFNSTSSTLLNNSYNDSNGEEIETQKATRLKFWRRPKIGFTNTANNNSPNLVLTNSSHQPLSISPPQPVSSQSQQPIPQQQGQTPNLSHQSNNNGTKISQSYSSQAIRIPSGNGTNNGYQDDVPERKGGKFAKSRSTNIIDSFLSNNNLHANSSNESSSAGSVNTNGGTGSSANGLFNSTIQKRADYEQVQVPLIVTKCLAEVELRGLDMEGIYRISGANSAITAIENAFSSLTVHSIQDEKQMTKLEDTMSGDIHAVTSALKRYFRKLPDPLIPYALYEEFIKVSSVNSIANSDKRILDLKSNVIDKLPMANKHTLHLLCKHLKLVNSYSSVNRMGFKNLSVIFAPTIARDETGQREMIDMGHRSETTEVLLSNSEQVFDKYFS
ncbi:Rho-type GTPase-activating protein [Scheffersomyces coipomensis]|uniref:Rho-type GTPase-activating protein n=1 Tax=Scheffersomyces coipomensis TaxID=1788519 RepID=UPI00315C5F30